MNLQSLYDLKDRLEHCAIAGTSLITEDFRLKRAMDAFSPLAAASPVFARIKAGCDALLCAPAEQRGAALLDVLGLVDAVVYTQGSSGVQGEPVPVPESGFPFLDIPYRALSALKDALTGTGGGRMAVISQFREEHPEYFSDRRVVEYTVRALGSSYSERAELAETVLKEFGESIVPLLKDGFQPDGRTEMVRRVRVVANIRGGEENEWYKSVLPESKKAVREAIITALGYAQDNTALLLELCRSEKGTVREAAMKSLACMDSPEAREFWQTEVKKHPSRLSLLEGIDSVLAADIASAALKESLEILLSSKEKNLAEKKALSGKIDILRGKYSESVQMCWLELAPFMDRLEQIHWTENAGSISVAIMLERCMHSTVEKKLCTEVFSLARELHEKCPRYFAAAAFTADMMELSPDALYDKYAGYFGQNRNERTITGFSGIMSSIGLIQWIPGRGFCYDRHCFDRMSDSYRSEYISILSPDPRWAALLCTAERHTLIDRLKGKPERSFFEYDESISGLIDPDSPESCRTFGRYFYERMISTLDFTNYGKLLVTCGWTEWDGVLSGIIKKAGKVNCYELIHLMECIPADSSVKLQELSRIEALISAQKVNASGRGYVKEKIEELRAQLENEQ